MPFVTISNSFYAWQQRLSIKNIIIVSLLPAIVVGIYIALFGLNIPFLDQWAVVPLLQQKQQGLLSLSALFAQHNEHRPFFPRLIWLTLAGFTCYNVNVELWLNLLLSGGTFAFFVNRTIKMWKQLGVSFPPLLIPLMSLLVFNLGQFESWLQGFQTVMFLAMACVIIGLFVLGENSRWRNFFFAVILGVIANYSAANGLIYWPIGLMVILATTSQKTRVFKTLLWFVFSAISIGVFFIGWVSGSQFNFRYLFSHLLEFCLWVLNFLGAPIMNVGDVAWFFGLISVGLYVIVIGYVVRNLLKADQWKALVPHFAVVLFLLLTGLSIAFGRIEMGMTQSTVSRYLTMTVWYWAVLLALLPLLNIKSLYQRIFYSLITISLVLLMVIGGLRGYISLYRRILPAYQAVQSGQTVSDDVLARIYINTDVVRKHIHYLCENSLSVCADRP